MTEKDGLAHHLERRIAVEGPLTVAAFMGDVLGHPRLGYYATRDPFGAGGDFITAPEISQMFGELIGLWCAHTWSQMGAPPRVNLVELGPGRGTLMKDALRAAEMVPAFRAALSVHLIETSPTLRGRQGEALSAANPVWHDTLAELPEGPLLLIANEFFDALPIRQFQRTDQGWHERLVDVAPEGDGFRFVLDRAAAPGGLIPAAFADAEVGGVVEICPAAMALAREIGERIQRDDGAALVIDYGHAEHAVGDTLQAIRRHRYAPVLEAPGEADITAHVDFAALVEAATAAGARSFGPVPQGAFLSALGIRERAQTLRRYATPDQASDIDAAVERLIASEQMGMLFKVLGLTDPRQDPPVGFDI